MPLAGSKVKLSQIQLSPITTRLPTASGGSSRFRAFTGKNIATGEFVGDVLTTFFKDYDRTYPNGTESKIAFYCPSIEKLNTEILPAVRAWYDVHRPGRGDAEIFRFYRGVKKSQKAWALPKDSDAVFNNLDQPHVKKRVVLLVAIGTEGWDCKSLTAVALPRRETTKNFVLQTTCRCLREVVSAKDETALDRAGEGNYDTLDKELKENYSLSIADLRVHADETVNVLLRKPKLGRLRFKNVRRRYSIIREQRDRDVAAQTRQFRLRDVQDAIPIYPDGHGRHGRPARARQCRHADPRRCNLRAEPLPTAIFSPRSPAQHGGVTRKPTWSPRTMPHCGIHQDPIAIREVMSETGSVYVHLDWHIGHYVKILLDEVFGEENFQNEIIWYYYNKMQGNVGRFATNHATIFFYRTGRERFSTRFASRG